MHESSPRCAFTLTNVHLLWQVTRARIVPQTESPKQTFSRAHKQDTVKTSIFLLYLDVLSLSWNNQVPEEIGNPSFFASSRSTESQQEHTENTYQPNRFTQTQTRYSKNKFLFTVSWGFCLELKTQEAGTNHNQQPDRETPWTVGLFQSPKPADESGTAEDLWNTLSGGILGNCP